MATYVDPLNGYGWKMRGHVVRSCHLFADTEPELHAMAAAIGMKVSWFQISNSGVPHYDLTEKRCAHAIQLGAVLVDRKTAVTIWTKIKRQTSTR